MEENDWKPKEIIDKYKKINGNGTKLWGMRKLEIDERKREEMR